MGQDGPTISMFDAKCLPLPIPNILTFMLIISHRPRNQPLLTSQEFYNKEPLHLHLSSFVPPFHHINPLSSGQLLFGIGGTMLLNAADKVGIVCHVTIESEKGGTLQATPAQNVCSEPPRGNPKALVLDETNGRNGENVIDLFERAVFRLGHEEEDGHKAHKIQPGEEREGSLRSKSREHPWKGQGEHRGPEECVCDRKSHADFWPKLSISNQSCRGMLMGRTYLCGTREIPPPHTKMVPGPHPWRRLQ